MVGYPNIPYSQIHHVVGDPLGRETLERLLELLAGRFQAVAFNRFSLAILATVFQPVRSRSGYKLLVACACSTDVQIRGSF